MKNKFKDFLNENVINDKNDIIKFVTSESYFDYEGDEDGVLHFSTRKNGSVSNETASQIDVTEGCRIRQELYKYFHYLNIKLEVVDEWVLIFISDFKENVDKFKYTFIKDFEGSGFSSTFDSMDELIKKYGDWIEVDWENIKKMIDNINIYPEDTFTGWHRSRRFLIKKVGEEGNTWGYNFYIQKLKKNNN